MRRAWLCVGLLLAAGCAQTTSTADEEGNPPASAATLSPDLHAEGSTETDQGANRTFAWSIALGRGGYTPLAGTHPMSQEATRSFPVDVSVAAIHVTVEGSGVAGYYVRDADSREVCSLRAGQVCQAPVQVNASAEWTIRVVSFEAAGVTVEAAVTLSPTVPVLLDDGLPASDFLLFDADHDGGEPTLAVANDGRVLVVAGQDVLRLDLRGPEPLWEDVTPPFDAALGLTLDPFLVGDAATGRIYVSQLAACQRIAWTDDAGDTWQSNPVACGGPDQHHQKLAVGPAQVPTPSGRAVHMMTMNLATWLATNEVVVTHAVSLDDGFTWVQSPAMVPAVHGLEARAIGNVAVAESGQAFAVAYLCDAFNGAAYEGLGLGRSGYGLPDAVGAAWFWTKVAEGGGACQGIDPGLAVRGPEVHLLWWDASSGRPALQHGTVEAFDVGQKAVTEALPTAGLRSFVLEDLAASEDRLAAIFLATPDSDELPNDVPGWARWFPYIAIHDGTAWNITRLEEHPVQIGRICMEGPLCLGGSRNLLDFNDVQFGPDGRVYATYTDGCLDDCSAAWQSRDARVRIVIEPA